MLQAKRLLFFYRNFFIISILRVQVFDRHICQIFCRKTRSVCDVEFSEFTSVKIQGSSKPCFSTKCLLVEANPYFCTRNNKKSNSFGFCFFKKRKSLNFPIYSLFRFWQYSACNTYCQVSILKPFIYLKI